MQWKEVFANYISDKGLKSRINKEIQQFNNSNPHSLILKNKGLNTHFSREDRPMVNSHMKRSRYL